jgi:hypothetical protein
MASIKHQIQQALKEIDGIGQSKRALRESLGSKVTGKIHSVDEMHETRAMANRFAQYVS